MQADMDRILIKDLAVFYHVGVSEEERAEPQRLLLSIEMATDFSAASASDDLSRTIDYHAVAHRLLGYGQGRSWKLLERLAAEIAEMILKEFKPDSVSISVKKFVIREARYVEVVVSRPIRNRRSDSMALSKNQKKKVE